MATTVNYTDFKGGPGETVVEWYCTDLETNALSGEGFSVPAKAGLNSIPPDEVEVIQTKSATNGEAIHWEYLPDQFDSQFFTIQVKFDVLAPGSLAGAECTIRAKWRSGGGGGFDTFS